MDFEFNFEENSNDDEIFEEIEENEEELDKLNKRSVKAFKTMGIAKKMKILSEKALDESDLPWTFNDGEAWHCFSFGDVDSLTYLRHIVRQQKCKYILISTWCMALEDCKEVESWIKKGQIERIDFYVGEIFKNGYRGVYDYLRKIAKMTNGRVARFRNHSKVMVVIGDHFNAVIESSANVNTNPRCENTCITIDKDLAYFYKSIYDGINSFDKGFEDWKPLKV